MKNNQIINTESIEKLRMLIEERKKNRRKLILNSFQLLFVIFKWYCIYYLSIGYYEPVSPAELRKDWDEATLTLKTGIKKEYNDLKSDLRLYLWRTKIKLKSFIR